MHKTHTPHGGAWLSTLFLLVLLVTGLSNTAKSRQRRTDEPRRSKTKTKTKKPDAAKPQLKTNASTTDAANRIARKLTQEIARSVAEIRQIPLRSPLKVRVYDAKALRGFLLTQLASGGGDAHLKRLDRALRRFGLMAPRISLRDAYVRLLQEQVAGLYDPAAKELRVM